MGGASWEERGCEGRGVLGGARDEWRGFRVLESLPSFEAEVRVLVSRRVSAFATQARSERHGPTTSRRQRGRLSPGVPPPLPSGLAPVSVARLGRPREPGKGRGRLRCAQRGTEVFLGSVRTPSLVSRLSRCSGIPAMQVLVFQSLSCVSMSCLPMGRWGRVSKNRAKVRRRKD